MSKELGRQRRLRRIEIAILVLGAVFAALDALAGSPLLILAAVIVALMVFSLRLNVRTVRSIKRADRPCPDYSAIAAMEREVYGETFKHDGAPQRTASSLESRWDGRTTHPDTTEPGTVEQYAAWLKGYVKRGGKPTHFHDHPFSREGFRYAASTVTVDSDYEYGSSLRHIIVANGVRTERTNPAGPFGGWAHTHMFFMHGYRTNRPTAVPVYSDPEFDAFR